MDFNPDDLYLHQKLMEVDCAPGLALAAATVRSVNREGDQYVSCIWGVPLDGGAPRQLTQGLGRDNSPRWSPDARELAFLSSRAGGAPQLHLLAREGGEARQAGQFELGVTQLRWTPDSRSVLATVALAVDPNLRGKRSAKQVPPRDATAVEVGWRLPYKMDGLGYMLGREIHLFAVDAESGQAMQLTSGAFDVQAFAPSPDGGRIAYSRTREGRYGHRTDLWVCDGDGTHHRRLTEELATVMQPTWSPDGRWIAFGGAVDEGDGQTSLWLFDVAGGQVHPLGPASTEVADTENMYWSADSGQLIMARATRGRHEVVSVSVPDGAVKVLVAGKRQLGAFGCNGEGLVYSIDAPDQPSELFTSSIDGQGERQVSEFNPWWGGRLPIDVEDREFRVPDGRGGTETIQGWLLRARGSEGPLPLLDDAHGGPAAYALLDFDTNVYWQSLVSRGWCILLLNPVGSSSFGREFCERLAGHWGEYDLPQHLEAIRQLQDEGVCDERVAIVGKSYGGYFASWSIGHTRNFRAAVVMAPVGNIETHYGTSDGGYYADPLYVDAAPRFDRHRARELSPLQYIERAVTPTLFMQGKDDERCPKCQSEELFVSLYRAGDTPAELVLYPGEDHHFLGEGKPSNRADAAHRIIDWVTQHAGQELPACAPDEEHEESQHVEAARA